MSESGLVVVGASLAGIRAVEAARRGGFTGPITMIGGESHLPYDRPALSKQYLIDPDSSLPYFRQHGYLTDELGIELRLGTWATGLDPERRTVRCSAPEQEVGYDSLVIATGGTPLNVPGADGLADVHTLRTLDDAQSVRAALDAGARTVVIGGGFIGSEVASAARKRGLPATVLEALPVPLVRSAGESVGHACAALHAAHGTDLRCDVKVAAVEDDHDGAKRVVLDDGTVLAADVVVVGVGVRPATAWLAGSGVALHERDGGVICDERLATGLPGVYAAGDVAHWPHPLFDGELLRLEHWTNAAEQGALAAKNALGLGEPQTASAVPYFWSDWYESRVQFVGVPEADEIRPVSEELGDPRFLALYRRGDRITGTLTIDRPTQIMKYRKMIARQASWTEALEFAGAKR